MNTPTISVIVPVYKVEKYIRCCLDSIVTQTFADWECILIDDGSPDNSGKICDEYAEKDGRFRVIHQKNAGVSAARNAGLNVAKGAWITFVDSDDWIEPETYNIAYKRAIDDGVDLVQWSYVVENGMKSKHIVFPETFFSHKTLLSLFDCSMWNKMVSAKLIIENKLYFPVGIRLSEDRLFSFQCYLNATKCLCLDKCFYHYRMNGNSASHSMTKDMIIEEVEVIKQMEELASTEMKNLIFFQKMDCKNHILLLMQPTDLDLFQNVFPEINNQMIEKTNKKKAIIYYLIFNNFKKLARLIIRVWRILH